MRNIVFFFLFGGLLGKGAFSLDEKPSLLKELIAQTYDGAQQLLPPQSEVDAQLDNLLRTDYSAWSEAGKWAGIASLIGPFCGLYYFGSRQPKDNIDNWMNFFKGVGAGLLLLPTVPVAAAVLSPPAAGIGYISTKVQNWRNTAPRELAIELTWQWFDCLHKKILEAQNTFARADYGTRISELRSYLQDWRRYTYQRSPKLKINNLIQYGPSEEEQLRMNIVQAMLDSSQFDRLTMEQLQLFLNHFDTEGDVNKRQAALIALSFAKTILDEHKDKEGYRSIGAVIQSLFPNEQI